MDAEQAAVGDRPGVGDRELAGALAAADGALGPIPDEPRAELGEALGRVAAVEHVEHVLELLAAQLRVGLGGGDHALDLVDLPLLVGDHRDDVLGEHVERVARDHRLLDLAGAHPLGDDRALEQVGAELGEDPALGDGAELVSGAADPLDPPGHGLRRFDLDHEVDRAHVDPQLERRGGDDAGKLPRLEQLLDHLPLLAREGAVVGAGDLRVAIQRYGRPRLALRALLVGQLRLVELLRVHLVEALGHALGAAAVVDEDDRRGVLANELQQLRVDRRPDRVPVGRVAGHLDVGRAGAGELRLTVAVRGRRHVGVRAGVGHVLDRHDDLEVHLLGDARVDDLALAARADEEVGDPLQRALRRREADPLKRLLAALAVVRLDRDVAFEPLQRQRHVRAALGRGDGMDLVDDQRLDVGEDLARPRGHHQVQRLGRGDQDVGRVAQHRLAILLRGVAGAQPDRDVGPDPGQGRPQVAFDVVGEGLERRDVDELDPAAEPLGLARQAVDPPEERGQGLAGAGWRADQRVGAGGDRRPARRLGGRRPLEGALEPGAGPLAERRQRVGALGRLSRRSQPVNVSDRRASAIPRTSCSWPGS